MVHAIHGCSNDEYRGYLDAMVAFSPDLIIDDGGDLTVHAHKAATPEMLAKLIGACEQTTSGVLRMKNMTTAGSLKCNCFFLCYDVVFAPLLRCSAAPLLAARPRQTASPSGPTVRSALGWVDGAC